MIGPIRVLILDDRPTVIDSIGRVPDDTRLRGAGAGLGGDLGAVLWIVALILGATALPQPREVERSGPGLRSR
jgi:hypothetical protein